jgi:1-acyl-sn-glycerol-3-phosphate acyltransferase
MSSIDYTTTLIGSPARGGHATLDRPDAPDRRRPRHPAGRDCDVATAVPGLYARIAYRLSQQFGRSVFSMTMNVEVVRPEAAEREGGYVLAVTHLSHLDPLCVGLLVRRKVDWMARLEFFRHWIIAAYLWSVDAFPVNRFGYAGSAIRRAVARAARGRAIGIFPEGGVSAGPASACRGGPIKRGACVVAQRAGVPIVPCVILGTHRLNHPLPWIPYRRGNLWVIFGHPIEPRRNPNRREARFEMAEELRRQFQSLAEELRTRFDLPEDDVP